MPSGSNPSTLRARIPRHAAVVVAGAIGFALGAGGLAAAQFGAPAPLPSPATSTVDDDSTSTGTGTGTGARSDPGPGSKPCASAALSHGRAAVSW